MRTTWKKTLIFTLIAVMAITLGLAGCGGQPESGQNGKKTVRLGYVNWAEGVAMTYLAKVVLEEKMGYQVEVTMADVAPVFSSVANGDYDAFLDTWLPVTHETYMKEYGDRLVDLGTSFVGGRIGLVVPEYVTINSIEELNSVKDKMDGRIVGVDSGAGMMKATDQVIKDYQLDYQLMSSSGPAMTAALKDAIEKQEWIVVTGWKPHWKFATWKLKFLEEPKGIYGGEESIHIVGRKDIEQDLPEVAQFFKNFKLNDEQLGSLMGLIAESDDPLKSSREWVQKNEQVVTGWLPQK